MLKISQSFLLKKFNGLGAIFAPRMESICKDCHNNEGWTCAYGDIWHKFHFSCSEIWCWGVVLVQVLHDQAEVLFFLSNIRNHKICEIKFVKLLQHCKSQFHSGLLHSQDTVDEIKWDQVRPSEASDETRWGQVRASNPPPQALYPVLVGFIMGCGSTLIQEASWKQHIRHTGIWPKTRLKGLPK